MATGLGKTFSFTTVWQFDARITEVWPILVNPANWPTWWDGLEDANVEATDSGHVGSRSTLVWRAPLSYRLRLELELTGVDELRHTAFTAAGDLVGEGSCDLSEADGITTVTILWNVAPTKPWMRSLGTLLTPLFRANHASLMRAGYTGLCKQLKKS